MIEERAFLSAVNCALLVKAASIAAPRMTDAFWSGRLLYPYDVAPTMPDAAALMIETMKRAATLVRRFYDAPPLFADTVNLVRWRAGQNMPVHVDNADPRLAHREFSAVVYLQDDFDGGELYFPHLNLAIKPQTGMLVAFPSGPGYAHGVRAVTSGERLTLAAFFTSDESHAMRLI